jgi:glutathione S-transferase
LLQDGDFVIGESLAIVEYLSEAYADGAASLIPEDVRSRARHREWCSLISMELDATSLYVVRRHEHLSHIYGEAPAAVAGAEAYFQKQFRHVETAFADGRALLMGERLSAADILLGSCIDWAISYGRDVAPHAHAYLERLHARPAYRAARIANEPQTYERAGPAGA